MQILSWVLYIRCFPPKPGRVLFHTYRWVSEMERSSNLPQAKELASSWSVHTTSFWFFPQERSLRSLYYCLQAICTYSWGTCSLPWHWKSENFLVVTALYKPTLRSHGLQSLGRPLHWSLVCSFRLLSDTSTKEAPRLFQFPGEAGCPFPRSVFIPGEVEPSEDTGSRKLNPRWTVVLPGLTHHRLADTVVHPWPAETSSVGRRRQEREGWVSSSVEMQPVCCPVLDLLIFWKGGGQWYGSSVDGNVCYTNLIIRTESMGPTVRPEHRPRMFTHPLWHPCTSLIYTHRHTHTHKSKLKVNK